MTTPIADHLLQVVDLIGRPGASRNVDAAVAVPEHFSLPLARPTEPLRVAGIIESVVDGLLVRGTVRATMLVSCARCLVDMERDIRADVVEFFADTARVAGEVEQGYEVRDGCIDIEMLLRDSLIPAVPYRPLCRPECRGLCPQCGADLNHTVCDCEDLSLDPRWAALQRLRLPEERA